MITDILTRNQGSLQILLHQRFWRRTGSADSHLNTLLTEEAKGSSTHSAGYHHAYSQLSQPLRQHSRFMGGWRMEFLVLDPTILCLNNGKLLTMAEVSTKHTLCQWNSKLHILPPFFPKFFLDFRKVLTSKS